MVEQPERYCSNCGQELKLEDQFCSNCGRPVHQTARVPTPQADIPVPPLEKLAYPPKEIASWYIRSTPSEGMIHLLHTKGWRSDHLSTPTLLRKEQEDGPNSRARH